MSVSREAANVLPIVVGIREQCGASAGVGNVSMDRPRSDIVRGGAPCAGGAHGAHPRGGGAARAGDGPCGATHAGRPGGESATQSRPLRQQATSRRDTK